jgi:hypothetical protein
MTIPTFRTTPNADGIDLEVVQAGDELRSP